MMGEVAHVVADMGDGDVVVVFKIRLLPSTMLPVNDCAGGADVDVVVEVFVGGGSERGGRGHTILQKVSLITVNVCCGTVISGIVLDTA